MKLRSKMIAVVGVVLIISLLFIMVNQKSKPEEENATSNVQTDSKQKKKDEQAEVAENDQDSISIGNEQTKEKTNKEQSGVGTNQEQMGIKANNENGTVSDEASLPLEKGEVAADASTGNQSSGLHFSSREEAIAFGFSRFSPEEIEIYNRATENGLTPEQEEMALQIAYSRFSPEEIAAIEEALGR